MDILGLFLPVTLRNFHFSKRLPSAMDPALLREISILVMPNDLLKKLEWGFYKKKRKNKMAPFLPVKLSSGIKYPAKTIQIMPNPS